MTREETSTIKEKHQLLTKEEAIKIFQRIKKILSIPNSDAERTIEALNMATEALQTPPISQRSMYQLGYIQGQEDALQTDTAEVVRCKDCRWYKPKHKDKEYDCPQGLYAVYENDYCSHGERREGE